MCINKEKLCHGILSHVEKHNKLHNLSVVSDSTGRDAGTSGSLFKAVAVQISNPLACE